MNPLLLLAAAAALRAVAGFRRAGKGAEGERASVPWGCLAAPLAWLSAGACYAACTMAAGAGGFADAA
eukprot:gene13157-12655_t